MIHYLESKKEIFWARKKLPIAYKHIEFLYKDNVRYKTAEEGKFKSYLQRVNKKAYELSEEV